MKGIKTGGRQKGSKNRTTEEVRLALLSLLSDNLDELRKDLSSLKGKDRAIILISLAKHCTPPALNPEKLSDFQLQQIVEYLKSKKDEETK